MSGIGDIETGNRILCTSCGTKKFRTIEADNGKEFEDFGFIVIHKKDCSFMKKLIKNSIEV